MKYENLKLYAKSQQGFVKVFVKDVWEQVIKIMPGCMPALENIESNMEQYAFKEAS